MNEIEQLKAQILELQQTLNDGRFLNDISAQTTGVTKTTHGSPDSLEDYEEEFSSFANPIHIMGRPDRWWEVTIEGKHYRVPLYFRSP